MGVTITHLEGPLAGQEQHFSDSVEVIMFGRSPDCQVVYPPECTEIGRKHFALRRNPPGDYTVELVATRYVEIDGQLRKVLVVIKMRGGNHSKDIREYVITNKGVVVIQPRSTEYVGLTTGIPTRTGPRPAQKDETAPEPKATG